jgi:hypothetical protein
MNYPFQEKTDKKRATQKVQLLDVEKSKASVFFANFETKTEKKKQCYHYETKFGFKSTLSIVVINAENVG